MVPSKFESPVNSPIYIFFSSSFCPLKNNLIPENTPHSISGGIIYFVSEMCNININKSAITNISKISEVTINKCYKKLYKIRNELIPEVILNKYNNN